MRPEWALYYCNRAKLFLEMKKYEDSLNDLNLAHKHSKNLAPSSKLTSANI